MMGILIIGAGNGGLAFGAKLLEKGVVVNLYDKYKKVISPIQQNENNITLIKDGKRRKDFKFNLVTSNLRKAVNGMKYIFVVVPAFAHKAIAHELVKYVSENQIIVLHPGRTGGALEFKNVFSKRMKSNIIAETETLLYACRKSNQTEINIYGVKKSVGISTIPQKASQEVTNQINKLLPYFHNSRTIISTSLSNIGAIFHPVPFLFNLPRVENKERFKFYHEGITPSIANLLESLDEERVNIGQSFGVNLRSAKQWLNENYNVNGSSLYESIQLNRSYKDIFAPTEVYSRYVMEDIPMSIIPMKEIAKLTNLKTPIMDSIIYLASNLYKIDFKSKARTIESMGLKEHLETPLGK